MSGTGGISGVSVAVITAGAVLVYAGLSAVSPLEVLRQLGHGQVPAVPDRPGSTGAQSSATDSAYVVPSAGPHPEFVAAAEKYAGDQYSEAKRNNPGYSDCSSFVCKAMRDAGATGAFIGSWPRTTITLKTWGAMHRIDTSQMGAGDLAISDTNGSGAHVVMITEPGSGVGQQNPSENVQAGPLTQLITVPYHVYRYMGTASSGNAVAA